MPPAEQDAGDIAISCADPVYKGLERSAGPETQPPSQMVSSGVTIPIALGYTATGVTMERGGYAGRYSIPFTRYTHLTEVFQFQIGRAHV